MNLIGLGHPGRRRVGGALEQGEDQRVVHDRQAGVVAGDQLLDRHVEQRGEDLPELEQAGEAAVVSAVGAVGRAELIRARQGEQLVRQVELGGGRLAAGQVEFQSLADQGVVRLGLLGMQVGELVRTEVGQGHGIHFESAAAGPSEILGRLARLAHDYPSRT